MLKIFNCLKYRKSDYEIRQRFKGIFEDSAIGMAFVSPEGKYLKVNDSLCKMLGYSEKELTNLTFQEITHPDDLEIDLSYVEGMLKGEISNYQMEKRYFSKSGNTIWIILSVSLVRDINGKPLYFVSQIQDISKLKTLTEELKETLIDLEKSMQFMTDREGKMVELKNEINELRSKLANQEISRSA